MSKLNQAPFVHRDAATREELYYYLRKWTQKRYSKFPVLYLGFHGGEESLLIGDARAKNYEITLDELADALEGKCNRRIVFVGGCNTLKTDARNLKRFLGKTRALAICGYRNEVDMLRSAAFELLLFERLLSKTPTIQGVRSMESGIRRDERHLCADLGFRMIIRSNGK